MEDGSLDATVRVREIKRLLYELEDLLDELEYHGSIRHRPSRRTWKATLFWLSSPLLLHTRVAPRLNRISRRLRYVTDRYVRFCSRQHRRTIALPKQQEEQFKFDGAAIIGRDRDKQYVKELLLQNNGDNLSILPIVGQPGLGKTSLARLVFKDEGEDWEFDFRVWISLGKDLDLTKIGTHIISEANKSGKGRVLEVCGDYSLGAPFQLAHDVQEILHNSSCLIVLDNLISMNANWLINLKKLFGDKQKCAKVIVTTSSKLVAEVMVTSSSYNLCGLSEEHCWTVFSEKAFGDKDAIVDPQYTEIGKKIVRRCNGIPMLAQFLGSMVHNQGMDTWLAARDEEFWKLEEIFSPKSPVFSSFMAIYYSMHHTLKLSFLYLSVFPRGSAIDKDELIRQWSALDLFESKLEVFSASLLGEIYIEDLLEASILEVVDAPLARIKCSSSVVLRVNNLAYDFLRYLTRDDVLHLDYGTAPSGSVGKAPFRYATLTCYNEKSATEKYLVSSAKAVVFRNCEAAKPIADMFPVLRNTRLLDLSGCPIDELPASVDQLNHLRYLNVSGFRIRALPNEMGCLQNLEFLDISKTCIEALPTFIGTFRKLKFLNMHGCDKLQNLPQALGDLKRLENLNLSCCSRIFKLPVSICDLHKLQRLDLSNCTSLDQLPHPFQLESLENLNLEGCFRLKQLPESFGNISSLRNLNLAGCSSLKQLPESIADLSKLEYPRISHRFTNRAPEVPQTGPRKL